MRTLSQSQSLRFLDIDVISKLTTVVYIALLPSGSQMTRQDGVSEPKVL